VIYFHYDFFVVEYFGEPKFFFKILKIWLKEKELLK
jgi:hypothetical protein